MSVATALTEDWLSSQQQAAAEPLDVCTMGLNHRPLHLTCAATCMCSVGGGQLRLHVNMTTKGCAMTVYSSGAVVHAVNLPILRVGPHVPAQPIATKHTGVVIGSLCPRAPQLTVP